MSDNYPLEKIEAELEVLLDRDQMDIEERKVRIAASHALADIQKCELSPLRNPGFRTFLGTPEPCQALEI